MKIILMLVLSLAIFSCNKKQETKKDTNKKVEVSQKKAETPKATATAKKKTEEKAVKVFNIEKECSVCHDLPKFAEKEKDFLDKKLDYHRKQKRITMTQEEYDALKKRILAKAKPEAKK